MKKRSFFPQIIIFFVFIIFSCRPETNIDLHIYLVRHGESYKNITPPGDWPPEKLDSLTVKGIEQTSAIAEYLKDKNIAAIFTSPAGRTRQTAEIIRQTLHVSGPVIVEKNFIALKTGQTSGDGESMRDGQQRAAHSIDSLSQALPGKSIVIVTHGDICSALLAHTGDTDITEVFKMQDVMTGSISEIIIRHKQWHIVQQGLVP
jgi:probable phosphoglycerate mutase